MRGQFMSANQYAELRARGRQEAATMLELEPGIVTSRGIFLMPHPLATGHG